MIFTVITIVSLCGCSNKSNMHNMTQNNVITPTFEIATWTRQENQTEPFIIYIEGDGHAYNRRKRPTNDPTPRRKFVRNMALKDPAPNVAYIARPCQFVNDPMCSSKYWTNARFSKTVIDSMAYAVRDIAGSRPVTLIGFSGGAMVAGLIATLHPEIKVEKIITYAGNLDHIAWTDYHGLPPLDASMNLSEYQTEYLRIPAIHYVSESDDVIPPVLVQKFVGNASPVIFIPYAGH